MEEKDCKSYAEEFYKAGINFDAISKKDKDRLINFCEILNGLVEDKLRAKDIYSEPVTDTMMIAKLGITRATYYRKPFLSDYLHYVLNKYKLNHSEIAAKDETISYLKAELKKLHARDAEYANLMFEHDQLKIELARTQERLDLASRGFVFGAISQNKLESKKEITIMSFNVNGFQSCVDQGFFRYFENWLPDIICLQETKINPKKYRIDISGYHQYWHVAKQDGYSGLAVFSRLEPLNCTLGIGIRKIDDEARVMVLEYDDFYILNCYFPNSRLDASRLNYRIEFDEALVAFVSRLRLKKPVIMCGDFNVVHKEIDADYAILSDIISGRRIEERKGFENILNRGFVDALRVRHPDKGGVYSWWRNNEDRRKNRGIRLDYCLIDDRITNRLLKVRYLNNVLGSDHCPVHITLKNL